MSSEMITNIANISLAVSVLVAVIFGLAQVRTSNRDRQERLTLETLRNFQSREFAELIYYINSHTLPDNSVDFRKQPEEDQVKLIQLSQQMESLGMMVYEKYINIDLVDKTLGSYVTICWEKYKPAFLDMRETIPDPFLGEYFQWLAGHIDSRMKDQPREPFFKQPAKMK